MKTPIKPNVINSKPMSSNHIKSNPINSNAINSTQITKLASNRITDTFKVHSEGACKSIAQDLAVWEAYHRPIVHAPEHLIVTYFNYIEHYQFNPLYRDILLLEKPDHSWRLIITADGWSRYMNRHPQFLGIAFRESTGNQDTIPTWIECSIHRADRCQPITVREHYQEVKGEHHLWIQMPRRMLRHQALSQCARLAFGIANLDSAAPDPNELNDCDATQIGSIVPSSSKDEGPDISPKESGVSLKGSGGSAKGSELLRKRLEKIC